MSFGIGTVMNPTADSLRYFTEWQRQWMNRQADEFNLRRSAPSNTVSRVDKGDGE